MTEQSVVKWIWLSELCGYTRGTASRAIEEFGSAEGVYDHRIDPKLAKINYIRSYQATQLKPVAIRHYLINLFWIRQPK